MWVKGTMGRGFDTNKEREREEGEGEREGGRERGGRYVTPW
jgi:hypothetical protein